MAPACCYLTGESSSDSSSNETTTGAGAILAENGPVNNDSQPLTNFISDKPHKISNTHARECNKGEIWPHEQLLNLGYYIKFSIKSYPNIMI